MMETGPLRSHREDRGLRCIQSLQFQTVPRESPLDGMLNGNPWLRENPEEYYFGQLKIKSKSEELKTEFKRVWSEKGKNPDLLDF